MSDFGGGSGGGFEQLRFDITVGADEVLPELDAIISKADKARESVLSISKAFEATGPGQKNLVPIDDAAVTKSAQEVQKLNAEAKLLISTFGAGSPAIKQRIGEIDGALDKLHTNLGTVRKSSTDLQSSLQLKGGTEPISKVQNELQKLGKTQSAAIAANKAYDQANNASGNVLKSFTGLLSKADDKLKESGLSIRSISVLLGAGLAAGIAGVFRITERVVKQIADFVGGEIELARQTKLTFGDGAGEIIRFSDTATGKLGASRDEALKTANQFAALARSLQLPARSFIPFSEGLATAAAVFQGSVAGFKGTEEAAKAIESALGGDTKALAQLNITTAEYAKISQEAFGKLPDQLTPAEQAIVGFQAVMKGAETTVREYGTNSKSVLQRVKDDFKSVFGVAAEDLQLVDTNIRRLAQGQTEAALEINDAKKLLLQESTSVLTQQRDELRAGVHTQASKEIIAAINEELSRRALLGDEIARLTDKYKGNTDALEANIEAFKISGQAQQQALGLVTSFQRAIQDGNERVVQAQLGITRATEDNAKRTRDVLQRNKKSAEDAAHSVDQAELSLSRAREDRATKAIQDSQRVADAIQSAARANRTAAENLQDFERDSARRVADLEAKIKQLKKDALQGFFDVQVQIINARIRGQNALVQQGSAQLADIARQQANSGTNQLATAERDLQREREDDATKLARLKRTVKETELDGIASVKKATLESSVAEREALRQVQDASDRLTQAKIAQTRATQEAANATADLATQNQRALDDANRALKSAEKERDRAISDAEKALKDFVSTLGFTVDELLAILDNLGLITDEQFKKIQLMRHPPTGIFTGSGLMAGGDVRPNTPVIWNEPGANGELLITPSGGTVISHADFIRLIRQLEKQGSGGGRPVNVTVNEVAQDPRATAFRVSRELMRDL